MSSIDTSDIELKIIVPNQPIIKVMQDGRLLYEYPLVTMTPAVPRDDSLLNLRIMRAARKKQIDDAHRAFFGGIGRLVINSL